MASRSDTSRKSSISWLMRRRIALADSSGDSAGGDGSATASIVIRKKSPDPGCNSSEQRAQNSGDVDSDAGVSPMETLPTIRADGKRRLAFNLNRKMLIVNCQLFRHLTRVL